MDKEASASLDYQRVRSRTIKSYGNEKVNYIVPSNLYPKKQFVLPNIMSEDEVKHLFKAPLTQKEYCALGLMYGCGMRISEVCNLRIKDIKSCKQRINIYQGKGAKDRYTLLPQA